MALISFCLGAASVVAASYAHKFFRDSRKQKQQRLRQALGAIRDGQELPDATMLDALYRKGWIADVGGGRAVTAAGKEFLERDAQV